MGKRSSGKFVRNPKDYYVTPPSAVVPLLPHLNRASRFIEPCAGNGALIDALQARGHRCVAAFDIEPKRAGIETRDAMSVRLNPASDPGLLYITNPPWTRSDLHSLIRHLAAQRPTWLLFDADWLHCGQATAFEPILFKVVSVGRVKWFQGSDSTGVDNAAWYLFDATQPRPTLAPLIYLPR